MDDSLLYRLWGKTNERGGNMVEVGWAYHPAICHMIDVGYVAEEWLRSSPWIMERFCQLAPGIDREILRRIIITIVSMHDLGKVHRSFQSKSEEGWKAGYGMAGYQRKDDCGHKFDHGLSTAQILWKLGLSDLPEWIPYLDAINAVAAHHGRLYDISQIAGSTGLGSPELMEYDECMAHRMIEAITAIFEMPRISPEASKSLGNSGFLMLLAGFASVADWFGSQSEVYHFNPIFGFDEARNYLDMLRMSERAERQLREAGLLSEFDHRAHDFASLFSFDDLHPLQQRAEEVPFGAKPGPEMVVVEAPMGVGKTEIALYLIAKAICKRGAEGFCFALPTQASSNALFGRIEQFTGIMALDGSSISLVLAHGGRRFFEPYARLLEGFERSRERVGRNPDPESVPSEIIAPAWMQSSKRTLLSSVGIGTIDQAMLGAITVKHAFVRLFALAGKVVVFDEIHAYDAYMNELIVHLLRWLNVLGTKVVLLSATLPRTLRTKLLGTFGAVPVPESGAPENDPYPQMLHYHDGVLDRPYTVEPESDAPGAKLPVTIVPAEVDERTVYGAELVMKLMEDGGCIAWIRNTVREAQEGVRVVQAMITERLKERPKDAVRLVLIHARFTRRDRNLIETELVRILGRKGGDERPRRMIVIATQVIEQSVDIDFDAMISDLAPVDLLLQRVGRLWRHERPREVRYGHAAPVLHVLLPNAEERHALQFGASSYIYDDETLARSATMVLERPEPGKPLQWGMPDACRTLVSRLYDYGEERWTPELLGVDPERLDFARARCRKERSILTGKARKIRMPEPDAGDLMMETAFRDDDYEGNVALSTRHGGAGATVVLFRAHGSKVRLIGEPKLTISAPPEPHQIRRILDIEKGVMLSTVSFPWYEPLVEVKGEGLLGELEAWWRDRHPYDNKIFLLLDSDGSFTHPQFTGYYSFDDKRRVGEGLVVQRTPKSQSQSQSIPVIPFDEM